MIQTVIKDRPFKVSICHYHDAIASRICNVCKPRRACLVHTVTKRFAHKFKNAAFLLQSACVVLLLQQCAGSQFASHVRVSTPGHSYAHGVGDPLAVLQRHPPRSSRRPLQSHPGYPRHQPSVPFTAEEGRAHRGQSHVHNNRWHNNDIAQTIPLLPPSPYKVDSPDPESLWPLGLFLPPVTPLRYRGLKRSDSGNTLDADKDPYLLQGSEAVAAYTKSSNRGPYFHEIPHIKSLLANQHLRVQNNLKPHRIASIRNSWPYNRP